MELLQDVQGGFHTGNGTTLPTLNKPFWVQLTSITLGAINYYGWTEITGSGSGPSGFIFTPGGRSGTATLNPAFHPNALQVPVNSFVRLQRLYFDRVLGWVYAIVGPEPPGPVFILARLSTATTTPALYNFVEVQETGTLGIYQDVPGGITGSCIDVAVVSTLTPQFANLPTGPVNVGATVILWKHGQLGLAQWLFRGPRKTSGAAVSIQTQSVGGAAQALFYQFTNYDTDGYTTGGGSTKLIAPVTGIYLLSASVEWFPLPFGSNSTVSLLFRVNGLDFYYADSRDTSLGLATQVQCISGALSLGGGSYVELCAAVTPNNTQVGAGITNPIFAMTLIGGAL